jgi:hypothetical protein
MGNDPASQADFDATFLHRDVPLARMVSHSQWQDLLAGLFNKPGMKVLEIGSREVTSESTARKRFANAQYVGFDFYAARNVDVVGDAHKLSSYLAGEKFDLIYSAAVLEHLAMPWIVATEIAKLLKVGGMTFHETHFSFSSHERPWHFFQFSDMALRTLFSRALGFECIEAGMSNPIVGRFSALADPYLQKTLVTGLYCHSAYLGRKIREVESFRWEDLDLADVVGQTKYPEPQTKG